MSLRQVSVIAGKDHRITAALFGIGAIVWGAVVGWNVIAYAKELLAKVTDAEKTSSVAGVAVQSQPPVPYWELGVVLFLITLAIWLLRVLVRVVLSNLHQGADAASRATMTQAYLALMEGGNALSEKDRMLILTTLFRPMTTGLIKDDGMPPSFAELVSRLVGGRG